MVDSEEFLGASSVETPYEEGACVCEEAEETGELSFEFAFDEGRKGEVVGVRGEEGERTSEGGSM